MDLAWNLRHGKDLAWEIRHGMALAWEIRPKQEIAWVLWHGFLAYGKSRDSVTKLTHQYGIYTLAWVILLAYVI